MLAVVPVHLVAKLPPVAHVGERVLTVGKENGAPRGSTAELEGRPGADGRWRVLARAPIRHEHFKLSWRAASSDVELRVLVVHRHAILARTPTRSVLVGPAPVYCKPAAVPTALPAGDGVIVGGTYISGGPAPGVYECRGDPYTVTLTNAAGVTVLTQQVGAGIGYALVVPVGSYVLSVSGGGCTGQATVNAGKVTNADTVCDVP
jgi:hypothetical protein